MTHLASSFIEVLPDGAVLVSSDHHILECNQIFSSLFSCPKDALIGSSLKPRLALFGTDSWHRWQTCCQQHDDSAYAITEFQYQDEQQTRYLALTLSFLPSPPNSPTSRLAIWRDITHYKANEAGLRRLNNELKNRVAVQTKALCHEIKARKKTIREERHIAAQLIKNSSYLDSILQSSNTAIVATSSALQVRYFNPEAERIFGMSRDQVMGKSIHEIHLGHTQVRPKIFQHIIAKVKEKGTSSFELKIRAFTLNARVSIINDSAGQFTGFLLMAHDISKQKQAEAEKKATEEKLRKAEKMEAIGLMAGGVAHDLNNILAGIVGYPELLLLNLPEESEMRELLEAIHDSGQRAGAIVSDLLTVARGVADVREPHDLNEIINQYLNSPECQRLRTDYPNIEINAQLDRHSCCCACSPVHLKKVLMNIVTNGVEAVGRQGKVTLISRYLPEQQQICLKIKDTGSGIPPQELEHIFEPFYTKKMLGRSGTGLGLTIAWNTIKAHQGTIEAMSDTTGTTFLIHLPSSTQAKTQPNESQALEAFKGEGTVLVVDDEPLPRDIALKILKKLGYQPQAVESGEAAIQYLSHHPVDLVLIDMLMSSGMNGRETYEKIITLYPGQKALIASGYSENEEVQKALQLGIGGFVKKPYTIRQLAKGLKKALGLPHHPHSS